MLRKFAVGFMICLPLLGAVGCGGGGASGPAEFSGAPAQSAAEVQEAEDYDKMLQEQQAQQYGS